MPDSPAAPMVVALPGWLADAHPQDIEDAAFLSGATLAILHPLVIGRAVPQPLRRARLALAAAEACAGLAGRREGAAALRDAVCLLRTGDHPGPAGQILRQWTRAAARPLARSGLAVLLPGWPPEIIARGLDAPTGMAPTSHAAAILEAALDEAPRAETESLILADAALARGLGWDHLLPLLAAGLKPRELRLRGDELRHACHRALTLSGARAARLAADLARRSQQLLDVTPRLRAAGAERAVALFLSRDALPPTALTGFMSDRAARRLWERLVSLGALRELTGRDSFRLYGV